MPSSASERLAKSALRTRVGSARDQLSPAVRAQASLLVTARAVAAVARLPRGSVVASYAAKGSELDLTSLHHQARASGHAIAYPRVVAGRAWLDFAIADLSALVAGGFGVREPAPNVPALDLDRIAMFFVPGLVFDERGGRLGWGKGYYDATLSRALGARRLGVGFECQVVERVPSAAHDVLLHELFTEAGQRTFGA